MVVIFLVWTEFICMVYASKFKNVTEEEGL